ncbi:hypothetical protein WDU94_012299 [Cyamophila willieti]
MPRNRTLPSEKILQIFLDHKDIFPQIKELPKKSDPIWSALSDLTLQIYPAKPATIYTWFVCNRFNLRDHFFVTSEDGHSSDPESDDDSEDDEIEIENVEVLEKVCHISAHEWTDICPSWVNHRDKRLGTRARLILKKDWVHLVCRKFYEATRLPCCLRMQRHRVHVDEFTGKTSVTFKGRCSFCSATLTGDMNILPDVGKNSEDIPLHFTLKGSFRTQHNDKKRPLSGKLRTTMQNELKSKTANLLQKDWANAVMDFNSNSPCPLIPNLTTLRRAKADSTVKVRFDTDPTYALFKAKYSADFVNIIQDIGLDPFYVHYYSRQQIQVYNQYLKNPTAFFNSESLIAIDATGGVVRHVKKPNDVKSKAIFLYDINIHNKKKKKILTVGSMLSEKHNTVALTNFFLNWIKFGATVPKIVVVDMSPALMSACVQSFTQFSGLGAYLTNCGCIINNPDSFQKPHTYLKNDVAHSVKLITGFSSLKNANSPRTKAFFVRSICLILRETELKNVAEILRHIFTVALHETEGVNVDGMEMPSELSKNVLQTMIGNCFNPTTFEETDTNEVGEIEDLYCLSTSTMDEREGGYLVFRRWAASIKESVVEEMRTVGVGNRGNQQYLPGVVEDILYLCRLLPVWSAIMVPYFGYGSCTTSSCAVETHFGILKNTIFRNELPSRIDHFVTKHVRYNQGNILTNFQFEDPSNDTKSKDIELQSEDPSNDTKSKDIELQSEDPSNDTKSKDIELQSEDPSNDTKSKDIELQSEDPSNDTKSKDLELQCEDSSIDTWVQEKPKDFELHFEENWRGLNEGPMTKRKRTSYLEPNAEWEHIDLSNELKTVPIGILKNGSKMKGPIQIEKDKYILTNTCGFDSLIQILATAVCDNPKYKEVLREQDGNENFGMLVDIVEEIVEKGVTQGHFVAYTLRENNHWQMYNDLCDKSSYIPGKTDVYLEMMVFSI